MKRAKIFYPLTILPIELFTEIILYLDLETILNLYKTSKLFNFIPKSSLLIKSTFQRFNRKVETPLELYDEYLHQSHLVGWILDNYPHYIFKNFKPVNPKKIKREFPSQGRFSSFNSDMVKEYIVNFDKESFQSLLIDLNLYIKEESAIFTYFCFLNIKPFYQTPEFETFTRLFSYKIPSIGHTINLFNSTHLFQPRELNTIEKSLFKIYRPEVNPFEICQSESFFENLNKFFNFDKWKDFIEWDKLFLVGGSVLKCILKDPFESSNQDLDFFFTGDDYYDFNDSVKNTKDLFKKNGYQMKKIKKEVEWRNYDSIIFEEDKSCYKRNYQNYVRSYEIPELKIKMQFIWYDNDMNPNHIMNIFDLDCCQVGYNGKDVLCTFPFVQSINTGTMINYKLINDEYDILTFLPRIKKYLQREFALIYPNDFDVSLLENLSKDLEEEKMKVKGLCRSGQYSGFLMNNDSLFVCQNFLKKIECIFYIDWLIKKHFYWTNNVK